MFILLFLFVKISNGICLIICSKHLISLKKATPGSIRFHDLRHTYSSILIDLEENIKYVQNQMGRASINITLDIYGHLMKTVNKVAANRLGKAIFEEDGCKMVADNKKGANLKG